MMNSTPKSPNVQKVAGKGTKPPFSFAVEAQVAPYQPLHEKTLEQVLEQGDTDHDVEQPAQYVSTHACPAFLLGIVFSLRYQISATESETFRLVTKLGASKLQALPEIQELEERNEKLATEAAAPALAAAFTGRRYQFRHHNFVPTGRRVNVSVFWWVHGALLELSAVTALPVSEVTELALTAGIAASTQMVQTRYAETCASEIDEFRRSLRSSWLQND